MQLHGSGVDLTQTLGASAVVFEAEEGRLDVSFDAEVGKAADTFEAGEGEVLGTDG